MQDKRGSRERSHAAREQQARPGGQHEELGPPAGRKLTDENPRSGQTDPSAGMNDPGCDDAGPLRPPSAMEAFEHERAKAAGYRAAAAARAAASPTVTAPDGGGASPAETAAAVAAMGAGPKRGKKKAGRAEEQS